MKSRAFLVVLTLVLSMGLARADLIPPSKLVKVDRLERIHLGDSIDTLRSIAREQIRFGIQHRVARFHVYYFDPSLPNRCMNLQCGRFAMRIMAHGGFLMGGADARYLSEAEGSGHDPVLLVTDPTDHVEAIYRGVERKDLRVALREVFSDLR